LPRRQWRLAESLIRVDTCAVEALQSPEPRLGASFLFLLANRVIAVTRWRLALPRETSRAANHFWAIAMFDLDHAGLADRLLPALAAAGALLLGHRQAGVEVEVKADGSPVTAADREAEALLLEALAVAAPGVPVLAEETSDNRRPPPAGSRLFLVDALDGTREFIAGTDDFTLNVGLIEDDEPVFGLVLAPALGRLFATLGPRRAVEAHLAPGGAASTFGELGCRRIATVEPDLAAPRVVASRSHRSPELDRFVAASRAASVRRLGSSIKFCLLAAGQADVYPRFGPTSAWDTVAGHAILLAAGGLVTTMQGRPLDYASLARSHINPPFIAWGRAAAAAALMP
jgi:3'(2'), 5'-bisphosphate nucleotidase